jgi:peroxiredoxin
MNRFSGYTTTLLALAGLSLSLLSWRPAGDAILVADTMLIGNASQEDNLPPADPGYTLKGTIKGVTTGMAYLMHTENNKLLTDSAEVSSGIFIFKGSHPSPQRYMLRIKSATRINDGEEGGFIYHGPYLFIEDGRTMTLAADAARPEEATITGSPLNAVYDQYFNVLRLAIIKKQAAVFKSQYAASQNGEVELSKAGQEKFDAQYRELARQDSTATAAFIKSHAHSPAVAGILYNRYIVYKEEDKAEKFFDLLDPSARQSYYGQLVKDKIDLHNRTTIGNKVHDFEMNDTEGKLIKLADLRGKYVLIDFWASWCGPCRKENPNVVKAYNKYKDKNFTVLGVSLDRPDGKAAWLKAIKDDGLTWTQVSDLKYFDNAAAKLYGINAIPQNFLIDPTGKLIGTNLRGQALEDKLSQILH